ncbi:MAG: hypothetical protein MZV70_13100 [Desulfobacterales bacterium]|nr:hypothetical protein [Desulfobacterales bacterium]
MCGAIHGSQHKRPGRTWSAPRSWQSTDGTQRTPRSSRSAAERPLQVLRRQKADENVPRRPGHRNVLIELGARCAGSWPHPWPPSGLRG